jgi:hypothetical protein
MEITVQWFNDQFNVGIASKEGREPFLSIKGCRIVDGQKGAFVSWPATKNQSTGKYWSHAWASDDFNAVVLEKAQASAPSRKSAAGAGRSNKKEEDDSSIPF